ncbi:hypothetical protein OHA40_28140 [Nocardia sp. NBC_00508]|uniref:hypothetical protein n=1 Tax=Nocardia sp. NBC_00508 TaxID=2975992 RepID=UPI002E7FC2BA|nr:hypothetical protein [Nocardia sp. NBC_00508]WUD65458.1 hypothetical protein OHA40_28140 [Nocardia sp. NBC_00508]
MGNRIRLAERRTIGFPEPVADLEEPGQRLPARIGRIGPSPGQFPHYAQVGEGV